MTAPATHLQPCALCGSTAELLPTGCVDCDDGLALEEEPA